jgi:hypothetical protein
LICERSGNGDLSIGLYTKEQQGVFQQLEQKYGRMDLRKDEVNLEIYNKRREANEKNICLKRENQTWYLQVGGRVGSPERLLEEQYMRGPEKKMRRVYREQELTLE